MEGTWSWRDEAMNASQALGYYIPRTNNIGHGVVDVNSGNVKNADETFFGNVLAVVVEGHASTFR